MFCKCPKNFISKILFLVFSWTLNEVRSHFGSGQMWVRHKDGGRMITNYIFSLQREQKVEKKVFKRSLKLDSTRSFTINNGSTCRPERMKWKDVHVFFSFFFHGLEKRKRRNKEKKILFVCLNGENFYSKKNPKLYP